MDWWKIISNVASIATLVLFAFYLVGRALNIIFVKNEIDETLDREFSNKLKVVAEFDVGTNSEEKMFLTANHTLRSVKIYECDFSKKTGKVKKGNLYIDCGKLRNGFTFKFNTYFGEGIPQYMVEYRANDFTIGTLYFTENGKNGILDEHIYKKHTWKSFWYYLTK